MQTKLFVQNLTDLCSVEELQELFAQYGEVKSARIPTDSRSGISRGFGFVEMMTQGAARAALDCLNRKNYNGKVLRVAFSKEQGPRKRGLAYSYLF
ncbi:MAG: RNA-binding protein [Candidatus Melainabacteria bacterium]|nr:RNA-binding protein [Candidatus Melainabacteria bacterium]